MSFVSLREIPVVFLARDSDAGVARATGNNAAWLCPCGEQPPLIATRFPPGSQTQCPKCRFVYELQEGAVAVHQLEARE